MKEVHVREMTEKDWSAVSDIYQRGIDTGHATFQTKSPSWYDWNDGHMDQCRYVALIEGKIEGWIALSAFSKRYAYRGVAEVSIYVNPQSSGQGIGYRLMSHMINASEEAKIWTLIAGIFPENTGSVRLHEKSGFRAIGIREKIGEMRGVWRDVMLMERRSKVVNYQN
ncbi:GNAT family N-acetyltransferase [Yersinia alsatica]|uniref:GNAT family N-acetyltransferase n=1 Tax=Yersinia alsatica TaxID=2890317 RepID=UPI0011A02C0A|nr:GNAT family N-acetyltransferase [Yersinia alsatica]